MNRPELGAQGRHLATRDGSPQGLRPEIARIIEELARAAVRREYRQALKAAEAEAK